MRTLRQPRTARTGGPDSVPGVMLLVNDLGLGGAERALVNLVNNATRYRPVVAVLRPVLDLADELDPDIEIVSVGPPGRSGPNGTSPRIAQVAAGPRGKPRGQMVLELPGLLRTAHRLARAARERNCSVVSTFLNRSHTVALTARLLFARELRVVINVHELLSDHLDLHFTTFERWLMQEFIARTFPRAERIVTVADAVTADLVQHFRLPADRITVSHNPVDFIRIANAGKLAVDEDFHSGNTIVAVGRLVRLKGFDILIRAVARLPESMDARLLIVGDGVERKALERLISEIGIGHRVTLLGMRANPWQYMARAKVVAVPSRTEAFPSVIGEAFALSVPVVATRCSEGVADYLQNGQCGLLVPPENPAALASALERILRDSALRDQLAAAGKRRVEAFELRLTSRHYDDLLAHAAAGTMAGPFPSQLLNPSV